VLGVEITDLVVQQGGPPPLAQTRGAADDNQRRLLRVRAGHGVQDIQAADAIGDADRVQTVDAGVGVGVGVGGGEAGDDLRAGADDLDATGHQQIV